MCASVNDLKEVQIHGPVDLATDVAALVIHKSYELAEDVRHSACVFTATFGVPHSFNDCGYDDNDGV